MFPSLVRFDLRLIGCDDRSTRLHFQNIHHTSNKHRCDLGHDGVSVSFEPPDAIASCTTSQFSYFGDFSSHIAGNPWSQREKAGFNWYAPDFSVSAEDGVSVVPCTCSVSFAPPSRFGGCGPVVCAAPFN